MPIALHEEIRLLSRVDVLSDEQLEDLAKRVPDTFLEQEDVLYKTSSTPPRKAPRGFSSSRRAGCSYTR